MNIALVLFSLIIFCLGWILLVPLYLRVNTTTGEYGVSQWGTIGLSFRPEANTKLVLRVLGFNIPLRAGTVREKPTQSPEKKQKKPPMKKSFASWRFLVEGMFESFTVNRFFVSVDVKDVIYNAYLFPLFRFLSGGPVKLESNFSGNYLFDLEIEGRVYKLVWTFLRFLTKK